MKYELFDPLDKIFVRARANLMTPEGKYKRYDDKRVLNILPMRIGDKDVLANPTVLAHDYTARSYAVIQ